MNDPISDLVQFIGGPWDGLEEPETSPEVGIPCGATILEFAGKKIDGSTPEGKAALRRIKGAAEQPVKWANYRLERSRKMVCYRFVGYEIEAD